MAVMLHIQEADEAIGSVIPKNTHLGATFKLEAFCVVSSKVETLGDLPDQMTLRLYEGVLTPAEFAPPEPPEA